MDHLHWTITVLCISWLCGTVPRVYTENIVDTSIKAIDEVSNIMSLYQKALNGLPWKQLQNSLANLDRRKDEYSAAAGAIVAEIKYLMAKGVEAYKKSSSRIYDWSYYVVDRLKLYVALLFDDMDASYIREEKDLLIRVLENGIEIMRSAQQELAESSSSFNGAAGRLVALKSQFSSDFDSNSAYYNDQIYKRRLEGYGSAAVFGPIAWAIAAGIIEGKLVPDLNAKLDQVGNFYADIDRIVATAAAEIDETKNRLQNEIIVIGDLKSAADTTNTFVSMEYLEDLRDTVVESVNHLIAKCNGYAESYRMIFL